MAGILLYTWGYTVRGPDPFSSRGFKSPLFPHWDPPGSLFLCRISASLKPWGELGELTAVPERGASAMSLYPHSHCVPQQGTQCRCYSPKQNRRMENTCLRYLSPPNTTLLRNILISLKTCACSLKWMCVYMPVCTFNTTLCVNSMHLLYILKKK